MFMRRKFASLALALVLALSLVPAASAAPAGIAKASTQSVEVDGQSIQFQMYALEEKGGLTNYVKLRDVAHVLNGTTAQFSVGYDGVISITTGESYTDNGSEMTTPFSGDRAYRPGPGSVKVNGADVTLDAIVLTDDSGGAYTYFKLRDLGTALGFKVDWSGERGVFIETGAPAASVPAAEKDLTLADLQGSWLYVNPLGTAETELTISGDTFTYTHYVKESSPSDPAYYLYYTAPVTLKKEISDWKYSFLLGGEGDIPEYKVTAGNAELWKYGHMKAGDIVFPIEEHGDNWFMGAYRFEKISSPKYYGQIKAIVDAAKEKADAAQDAISKYPTYADFPGVPDFGAIYGLRVKEQRLAWGSTKVTICAYDYDEAEELACELFGDGDVKYYEIYDMVEKLKEDYYRILEECGYEESLQRNTFGDLLMVHKNDELGYRVDVYISLFGDGEFQIYIQPLR